MNSTNLVTTLRTKYKRPNPAVSLQTADAVIVALASVITELMLLFPDRLELLIVQTSKFDNQAADIVGGRISNDDIKSRIFFVLI